MAPDTKNPDYFTEKGISWLTPADLYGLKHKYIGRGRRDLSERGLKESSAQLMPAGTVLFSSRAPIGYVAIAKNDLATNQGFKSLIPYIIEMNEYIYYFLKKAGKDIDESASGTTFKEIPGKEFVKVQIPLPPLAEQRRIVSKVDQLMSLCDELEARQQKKRESHDRLNSAALDRLLAARAPEEFAEGWRRISDNFDLLYDAPENVGAIKHAILQLAVMGKLVQQDPNDESASMLFEKIKDEKGQLIKENKIRKSMPVPLLDKEEIPYELPIGWRWVRLDEISDIGTGSTPLKSNLKYYSNGFIPWVTSSATSRKYIEEADVYITQSAVNNYRLRKYPPGTLIIALYGQGKTRGQVSELKIEATINQACAALVFFKPFEDIRQYIKIVIYKKYDELRAMAEGGAQPNLNVGKIKETLIPLPPLAEQRRIVTRVDQLMSLCDELEAGLKRSQADSEKLIRAVVGRMLAGGNKLWDRAEFLISAVTNEEDGSLDRKMIAGVIMVRMAAKLQGSLTAG